MAASPDGFEALRDDVRRLGAVLGDVVTEAGGHDLFDEVESLRRATRDARRRDRTEHTDPQQLVDAMSVDRAEEVARAFAVLFHLVNLAEERHRVRVSRSRARDEEEPAPDTLAAALQRVDPTRLEHLEIHPVLTAHPTEARRRAVVTALRRIAEALDREDDRQLGDSERKEADRRLREEVTTLWHTALVRRTKLDPLDEVRTTMAVFDETLFRLAPTLYRATEHAMGDRTTAVPPYLVLGSWVGGDRDGNPHVTADVTREAVEIQADHVLRALENATRRIGRSLTHVDTLAPPSKELARALQQDEVAHPKRVAAIAR